VVLKNLAGRDLVSIEDLSVSEIQTVFSVADYMKGITKRSSEFCEGKIMATLFYEPSTRTRLSHEVAITRLGGHAIGFANARKSSTSKGETIADTVRMADIYSDIIVIRHPREGAAMIAAEFANVPVINAGDGAHEHPTQALIALYTIQKKKGNVKDLKVGMLGDLKFGRTVHSLSQALANFGAKLILISPKGLEAPTYLIHKLKSKFGTDITQNHLISKAIKNLDVLYVTRIQRERFASEAEYLSFKGSYVVNQRLLRGAKEDMLIMHPLPRVNEIDYSVDKDRRAIYFEQAANSVPVRMAIVVLLLGSVERLPIKPHVEHKLPTRNQKIPKKTYKGGKCLNPRCVSLCEPYVEPEFYKIREDPPLFSCIYCEHEYTPEQLTW